MTRLPEPIPEAFVSTPNSPKKDPLSSLFGQAAIPEPTNEASDTPEPAHVRTLKPVSRPMPGPILPPSPTAGPDPRQLAKMLAKAAVAKAGTPPPAKAEAPKPKAEPKPEPRVEARPAPRGLSAAPPPTRKLSALEAMELARKQEAAAAAAPPSALVPAAPAFSPPPAAPTVARAAPAAPAPVVAPPAPIATPAAPAATPLPAGVAEAISDDQLGDVVQAVLGTGLPGAHVYVANAMFAEDRKTMSALWRSHRARFLATHQIEAAVGASVVLYHLHHSAPRQLAAAHAVTDKGEYLLWVDLAQRIVVSAFLNPKQLVVGWQGE